MAKALFWFAFSLPFAGVNLLLSRTFFALQRPWIPTKLAAINVVVDIIVSVALYKPLGIAGPVIGTVVANVVMTGLQLRRLRIGFNGRLEGAQTTMITAPHPRRDRDHHARGVLRVEGTGQRARAVADRPDHLGGPGLDIAGVAYGWLVLRMRVPEARQIEQLVVSRLPGR